MESERSNQRQFYRVPAGFRVEAADRVSGEPEPHALKDISAAGLRLSSGEAMPPGQSVEIRFPDIDPDFVAHGSVVWCARGDGHDFEMGVRLDQNSPDYEQVCTRIQEIEKYRRTVEDLRGQSLAPEEAAREWFSKFSSSV